MNRPRHISGNRLLLGCVLLSLAVTLYVTRWGLHLPELSKPQDAAMHSQANSNEQKLIFAAGIVEGASDALEVRFEVTGRIREVHAHEGQRVRKDEVLAELDPEMYEIAVSKAESDLRTAELQSQLLANAEQGSSSFNNSPGTVKNTTRTVSDTHSATSSEQVIAMSQATSAELAVRREKIQLEKTQLKSPVDGTIIECIIHPGELTGPHERTAAFRIVDRTNIRVRAWVEELDAMDVTVGMPALAIASGSVDRRYRGTVVSCAIYMQPKSERHMHPGERVDIRVREIMIELEGGQDLLLGLPVEVFIAPGRSSRVSRNSKQRATHGESSSQLAEDGR